MWQQLLDQKIVQPLDLYFADLHRSCNDDERAFFAAVMAVSREGHLCLDLEAWTPPLPAWKEKALAGSKIGVSPYIKKWNHLFYLEKNFTYETRILDQLRALSLPVKPLDIAKEAGLTDEQRKAVHIALSHTLSVIEGGPGTGKTFLTQYLVQAMGPGAKVVLAAPTGKAAARLKQFNPQATCGTLHALLGFRSRRESSYLKADLIVIDESSMIDAKLFSFLLASVQKGQRIVFLGDGHQLPPVESGSLFGDLVDLLPTAHLRKCLRSDRKDVLQLAQDILDGKAVAPHQPLSEKFLIDQAVAKHCCILSPMRDGPFGVNLLNEKIFRRLLARLQPGQKMAVPILITRTDYDVGLYNGEMGVLWRTSSKPLYAEFPTEGGPPRTLPASALPPYELGYVLSVHKSQGSEFDHVVIAVPPGTEAFGREILYTAATRAKVSVTLCGEIETIQKTIARSSRRHSGLRLRWLSC